MLFIRFSFLYLFPPIIFNAGYDSDLFLFLIMKLSKFGILVLCLCAFGTLIFTFVTFMVELLLKDALGLQLRCFASVLVLFSLVWVFLLLQPSVISGYFFLSSSVCWLQHSLLAMLSSLDFVALFASWASLLPLPSVEWILILKKKRISFLLNGKYRG